MTDQPTLSDRLAKAINRVAEAEHHVSNQAALVAEMERTGQDARRSLMILLPCERLTTGFSERWNIFSRN